MNTPLERLLAKLPDAKRTGNGWQAKCPAHNDRRASLSITEGNDGRALVKCHAGCTADAICEAVGLKLADLFTPSTSTKPHQKPEKGKFRRHNDGRQKSTAFPTAREAVAELERRHGRRSAYWVYHNVDGDPIGVVVRWDLADGDKTYRPVSRYPDGWRLEGMPEPRSLYRLSDLAKASRVYVCEGEKAADAARSIGLTATTSPHGSKSATKADWSPLAGKEVVLLPDNDEAGLRYARLVTGILAKLRPAPVIKQVELPGLPKKGDIFDFVAAHLGNGGNQL